MADLVIRRGTVVDGTGAAARVGVDVAVEGGRITEVGPRLTTKGHQEIDAEGKLVTPGFVDIHTHYDGQVTWDSELTPSAWHGVTTTVMGNCGVGFAPARPAERKWLIELMESVEDIPGSALAEGIEWEWESFPEYLDALAKRRWTMDVGTHVPHSPLRAYVMGERALNGEPTAEDLGHMANLVGDGIAAGALGFSTSRTMLHRTKDGDPIPGTFAGAEEMMALGQAMAANGSGVFEIASDMGLGGKFGDDVQWMRGLAVDTGVTITYALVQNDREPESWREVLAKSMAAREAGGRIFAQVAGRPAGILMGLQTSLNPFKAHPTYGPLDRLSLAERVAELRKPEVKAAILGEATRWRSSFNHDVAHGFHKMFPLGAEPDYEPAREDSIAERAKRAGRDPYEFTYDLLLERDGKALIFFPLADFAYGTLDATWERLQHEGTVNSLSDGGAHCRVICDASTPTFMLSYWARDRSRGPKLPIEHVIKRQTSDTAAVYRLFDRGVIAPGYRADLNVIDFDRLSIEAPHMVHDLPAEGPRLLQRAEGYTATVCAGEVTWRDGEATGALPGRLLRGPKVRP
ncbi:MAG: amidohydrolase family protein [Acidimicrobiia bacterium]|nr:amidohydrolase family protein [Acidimicrobiia bacterium]